MHGRIKGVIAYSKVFSLITKRNSGRGTGSGWEGGRVDKGREGRGMANLEFSFQHTNFKMPGMQMDKMKTYYLSNTNTK